jgi:hypothetical protein
VGTRVQLPPDALVDDRPIYNRAHDVAVAYRLAMADVWVRLPLGALPIAECEFRIAESKAEEQLR